MSYRPETVLAEAEDEEGVLLWLKPEDENPVLELPVEEEGKVESGW